MSSAACLLLGERGAAMDRSLAAMVAAAAWLCLALAPAAAALEFDMLFQTKCVMEDISSGILVVGDYAAFTKDHPDSAVSIDVKVRVCAPRSVQH